MRHWITSFRLLTTATNIGGVHGFAKRRPISGLGGFPRAGHQAPGSRWVLARVPGPGEVPSGASTGYDHLRHALLCLDVDLRSQRAVHRALVRNLQESLPLFGV